MSNGVASVPVHIVFGAAAALSAAIGLHIWSSAVPTDGLIRVISTAAFVLVAPLVLLRHYVKRFEVARPDEWQLLIRDGKLVEAGVGACHFRHFFDKVVRFPSSIQKVNFRVEQVTSEMQGVVVTGFALWSVHREADGPWRAYKNLMLRDKDRDGTRPLDPCMRQHGVARCVAKKTSRAHT